MALPRIVEEFKELVEIPVFSRDERAIADVVTKKLKDMGFTVTEDGTGEKIGGNAGNIVARLEGDPAAPWVLLSAHLDRVRNPGHINVVIKEDEDKIVSDGKSILAADCVAGICVILDGVRRVIAEDAERGGIEIAFSVCEEVGVAGARHFDFGAFKSKIGYVFDCSGKVGKIMIAAPTKCSIKIGVHGKNAHAGNEPEKGLNAIKVAATAISRLREGRISPATTSNFGVIHAGTTTNVVCDYVEILAEARSTNDAELEAYLAEMRDAFEKTAAEFGTTVDITVDTQYYTFRVPDEAPVVDIAKKAMKNLGVEGFCVPGGGGMDGNHFNKNGIQAVGIAPGYAKNHTNDEVLTISEFTKCGELVAEIVKEVYAAK
ncbi:MAG: Peptidase T [Desulfovibrio sp.]